MTIGIKVKLKKDFSIIRETLERIGIVNFKSKTIYPSCYCIETKESGIYRIVHFKELFPLFDRKTDFNDLDRIRRDTTVVLLNNWKLVELINSDDIQDILSEKIDVVKYGEKINYKIDHKFKFNSHIILD